MAQDKVIRKASFNKNNKQLTVTVPKKQFKKIDPELKFGEELFVELKLVKKKKHE